MKRVELLLLSLALRQQGRHVGPMAVPRATTCDTTLGDESMSAILDGRLGPHQQEVPFGRKLKKVGEGGEEVEEEQ